MTGPDTHLRHADAIWDALIDEVGATTAQPLMVVASPGSRSTPLLLTALRPEVRLEVVIDERMAGFFALGAARDTGRPAVLLCTSGSALAHYSPAVVEACYGGVPLVVLSADRPWELQGVGASQTIEQKLAYEGWLRGSVALGEPSSDASAEAVYTRVRRVVALSSRRPAGPVHINAPFRKPLEPQGLWPSKRIISRRGAAINASPPTRERAPDALVDMLTQSCRGVIIAGPMRRPRAISRSAMAEVVGTLASRRGMVVWPEATSQLRFAKRVWQRQDSPFISQPSWSDWEGQCDFVLQLGAVPASIEAQRFLEGFSGARAVISELPANPFGEALEVEGEPIEIITDLLERVGESRGPAPVSTGKSFAGAGGRAAEGAVLREVLAVVPPDAVLIIGNSGIVRNVDTFVQGGWCDVDVYSQRGAAGIDGLIAGAAGVAACGDRPVILLVGDVSAAHDIGALSLLRHATCPVVVVIVDNGGGRLFERLPVAGKLPRDELERLFLTPPGLDFAKIGTAFGIPSDAVSDAQQARNAVLQALSRSGASLVVAEVDYGNGESK